MRRSGWWGRGTCGLAAGAVLAVGPLAAHPAPGYFRGGANHGAIASTRGVERLGGAAWSFETDGPVRGSPTVVDGTVYIGSRDGRLYALDAANGTLLWHYEAGAPVGGAPLVTADLVVFTTRGNAVHAVDRRTGRRAWTVRTGADLALPWGHEGWDYLLASPVLWEGTILVGSGDGHLYALDPADGGQRWRFATGGRIRSAPARGLRGRADRPDGRIAGGHGLGVPHLRQPVRGRSRTGCQERRRRRGRARSGGLPDGSGPERRGGRRRA